MDKKCFLIIFSIVLSCLGESILDKYKSYTFDEDCKSITAPYVGPLYMTGCANKQLQRALMDDKPVHIGEILPNKIRLFGDEDYPEEAYSFKKITYYKVATKDKEFYAIYIKAQRDSSQYEIVIELNSDISSQYDRTLSIFKNGNPETIILWIDNMRLLIDNSKKI